MKNTFFSIVLFFVIFNTNDMFAQNKNPAIYSKMKAIAIRLKPGEDLKMKLDEFVKENNIKAACILSCAGSLAQSSIRYANQPNAEISKGKFEIVSLSGTIAVTGSHLHISISDSTGKTVGGHLKEGSIIYTTAEIVIGILEDLSFERVVDSSFNYKELWIKKND